MVQIFLTGAHRGAPAAECAELWATGRRRVVCACGNAIRFGFHCAYARARLLGVIFS
jgi:hypothetical protein